MKIAIISGSAGDGKCGVGDYAYYLAQFLSLDAEVHLYYDRNHGPKQPPYSKLKTLELRPTGGYSALGILGFCKNLVKEGYDVVHIQYPSKGYGNSVGPAVIPQRLCGMQSRSEIVLTLHEWRTSHPMRRAVMDQMLASANAVLVTNEKELNALVPKFHHFPITAIPVGNVVRAPIQMESIWLEHEGKPVEQLAEPTGITGRIPFSLFHYGLPTKGKGIDRLLEALKLVREAGIDAQLHLFGKFEPGSKLEASVLESISTYGIADCVIREGHIPPGQIDQTLAQFCLGIFPFDEGFSSKRSSVASISHADLPIVVGAGSTEDHPYYVPERNNAASLAVLLVELFSGRLKQEWVSQVLAQREFAVRFSFPLIAQAHMEVYRKLVQHLA